MNWLTRLKQALGGKASPVQASDLEALLLAADVGPKVTAEVIAQLASSKLSLQQWLSTKLSVLNPPPLVFGSELQVVLMVGVNGSGKTTTLGKLAHAYKAQGIRVMLASADTFRAAARQQLAGWAERAEVPLIEREGSDPAAVLFDAIAAARSQNIQLLLADTAGRLGNQQGLMAELVRVKKVAHKALGRAPDHLWLVLDAQSGQNLKDQLQHFDQALGLTGLVMTKLEGSAKGGVLLALALHQPKPVYFLGVGEAAEDLVPFDAAKFSAAWLGTE